MIGILLVGHAGLAQELINACEVIMGKSDMVLAVDIKRKDSPDDITTAVNKAMDNLFSGSEAVLVMSDIFGGSPNNVSFAQAKDRLKNGQKVRVITGVNLPMLLEVISKREELGIDDLAMKGVQAGQKGIINIFERIYIDNP
jgi:PTS system mannose-specific IIA component